MSVPPLSALECGVCLTLVCQPVSLSCGHTFCRVCLIKTLRINKRCPTCRAVCHTSAEDQPEDVMIAEIIRRCFPELAERRRREAVEDRNNLTEVLPIFYYHMPMFPGETVSLRLYEPRYKLMMQRIMHTSRRFAYVPSRSSYRANIGDVALVAEVRDFDLRDGKELIAVKLASRVTVMCHFIEEGTQGLHYCRVKTKTDEVPPAGSTLAAETVELAERTRNLIHGTVEPIRSHLQNVRGDIPRNPESLSMWIAAFLPFSSMEKYALLHETSTVARLLACEPHLVSLGGNAPRDSFPRTAAPAVSESHEHRLDGSDSAEEVYPSTPSSEER